MWFKVINQCFTGAGMVFIFNFIPFHFILDERLGALMLIFSIVSSGLITFLTGCMIGFIGCIVFLGFGAEKTMLSLLEKINEKIEPAYFLLGGAIFILASSVLINLVEAPNIRVGILLANSAIMLVCGCSIGPLVFKENFKGKLEELV